MCPCLVRSLLTMDFTRLTFLQDMFLEGPLGIAEPCAAPKLSRTPGLNSASGGELEFPMPGDNTVEILKELGFRPDRILALLKAGAAGSSDEDDYENSDGDAGSAPPARSKL